VREENKELLNNRYRASAYPEEKISRERWFMQ
jgi:hypothetical protein